MDWYDEYIEEPVRDLVKALRNAGINTTNSCGHDMTIQAEFYGNLELDMIYNVCYELNINKYQVFVLDQIGDFGRHTFLEIMLPDKNDNYAYNLIENKDYILNKCDKVNS